MRNRYLWIGLLIIFVITATLLLLQTKAKNSYTLVPPQQISPSPAVLLVYKDATYGFSLMYPETWVYRAYEGVSGVGFRPGEEPNEPQYEYISLSVSPKPGNIASLPFEEYVKVAAINEIQNYQKLSSIKPFTTATGQTGYITTWMVQPLGGGSPTESNPIAYLPASNAKESIEVFLSDKHYMDVFTEMLSTFEESKK